MKNHCYNYYRLNVWFLIVVAFLLHSCAPRTIPPELFGTWKTDKHRITVRTGKMGSHQFTRGSAFTTLTINSDKTVDGYIGSAVLENGKISIKGFPKNITVEGDLIGKIFENDPLDTKEIRILLYSLKNGNIKGEIRYTEGGAYYPMAGKLNFSKEED